MKVTREMVLAAERCTGMRAGVGDEEIVIIHVVPKGNYPVCSSASEKLDLAGGSTVIRRY